MVKVVPNNQTKSRLIPQSKQALFWSVGVDKLDLEKNKSYIIHQTLSHGSLKDIKWLYKQYKLPQIQDVFINEPRSVYSKSGLNFAKNIILKLDNLKVNQDAYLTTAPRQCS